MSILYTKRFLVIIALIFAMIFQFEETFAQAQIRVSVTRLAVTQNSDCDGFGAGDSDFQFNFQATDPVEGYGNNNPDLLTNRNSYEETGNNGPWTNTTIRTFWDHTFACQIPNVINFEWEAFEDDLLGTEGNTGLQNVSINVPAIGGVATQQFQASSTGCAQTYQITFRVEVLTFNVTQLPDAICNAVVHPVNGADISYAWCGNATFEPGEPFASNDIAAHGSRWVYFIAPNSGAVDISTDIGPTEFGTELYIYHAADGVGCTAGYAVNGTRIKTKFNYLSFLANADLGGLLNLEGEADLEMSSCSQTNVDLGLSSPRLIAGQAYYVQISTDDNNPSGVIGINISDVGGSQADRTDIPCTSNNVVLTQTPQTNATTPATFTLASNCAFDNEVQTGQSPVDAAAYPTSPPGNDNLTESVWFNFIAPCSGAIYFEANNTWQGETNYLYAYDPRFAPGRPGDYNCADLTIPNNDYVTYHSDGGAFGGSTAIINNVTCLEPGYTYFGMVDAPTIALGDPDIWLYDPGSNAPGNDILCLALANPSYNVPVQLLGQAPTAPVFGNTTNSCHEKLAGEPVIGNANQTTWHYFTAPPSGVVNITVSAGTINNANFAVYSTLDGTINGCYGGLYQASNRCPNPSGLVGSTFTTDGIRNSPTITSLVSGNAGAAGSTVQVCCLIPGNIYVIQVDGAQATNIGTYTIQNISEVEVRAGNTSYIDPDAEVFDANSVVPNIGIICAGESINVLSAGSILPNLTSTTIKYENFDGSTPSWAYTIGTPNYIAGSVSNVGNDFTGIKNYSGTIGNALVKSFDTNNNNGTERSSTNTITFSNVSGLGSYSNLKLLFSIASLDCPMATCGGSGFTGAGTDNTEDMFIEVSTDAGNTWTKILTEQGNNNRIVPFEASVNSLSWGTNTIYGRPDLKSTFELDIPNGTSQIQFRMTATNNRINENWAIDEIKLVGEINSGCLAEGFILHNSSNPTQPYSGITIYQSAPPGTASVFNNNGVGGYPYNTVIYVSALVDDASNWGNYCPSARIEDAAPVVFLRPIIFAAPIINVCDVSVNVSGGLPSYNNTNFTYAINGPIGSPAIQGGTVANNGTINFTAPVQGVYTILVTDEEGCTKSTSVNVVAICDPCVLYNPISILPNPINNTIYNCDPLTQSATATITINGGKPEFVGSGNYTVTVSGTGVTLGTFNSNGNSFSFNVADGAVWSINIMDDDNCNPAIASGTFDFDAMHCPDLCTSAPLSISNVIQNCGIMNSGSIALNLGGGLPSLDGNSTPYIVTLSGSTNSANGTFNVFGNAYNFSVNQGDTWTVSVTDQLGCTPATTTNQFNPLLPNANAGADSVLTCTNTTINLNASSSTSGATFQWIGGPSSAAYNVTIPNTYTVVVSNPSNGCTATDNVVVSQDITLPNANAGADSVLTCTNTTINLNASSSTSGATFQWIGGPSSAAYNVTIPNTYTVVVSNPSNGCTATDNVVVSQDITLPNANAGADSVLTCTNTTINLNASSSTSGATFQWIGGPSSAAYNVTIPNTYTVVVSNPSNGCTATDNVVVSQDITLPNANAGADSVLTCTNTTINLNASSSTSGATFQWIGGPSSAAYNVTIPNTYTVVVSNPSNGCTATDNVVVSQDITLPNANAGADSVLTCTNTTINLNASSSTSGATFQWIGGPSSAAYNVTIPNTYTVVVSNPSNGCTATDNVVVSQDITLPNANAGADSVLTCTNTTINLNASSSTSGATFQWIGGPSSAAYNVTIPNTYTVVVSNPSNGCTATDNVVVSQDITLPNANAGADSVLTCTNTTINLNASSSTSGATFQWIGGPSSAAYNVTIPNTYTVVVSNPSNGCTATDNVVVSQDITLPNANIASPGILICSNPYLTLDGTNSSFGPNISYNWTTVGGNIISGNNTNSISVNQAGNYTLIVTNNTNGCTNSSTVNVLANTLSPSVNTVYNCNGNGTANLLAIFSGGNGGNYFGTITINGTVNNIINNIGTFNQLLNNNDSWTITIFDRTGCNSTTVSGQFIEGTSICNNCNDQLPISANYNYQCNGIGEATTNISFNGGFGGEYRVVLNINGVVTNGITSNNNYSFQVFNNQSWSIQAFDRLGCAAAIISDIFIQDPNADCAQTCSQLNPISINGGNGFQYECLRNGDANIRFEISGGLPQYNGNTTSYIVTVNKNGINEIFNSSGTFTITVSPGDVWSVSVTDNLACTMANIGGGNGISYNLPSINAGIDQTIYIGQSVMLQGSGGDSYSWSPINFLNDPNIANPIASPIQTTRYVLTASEIGGCSATDSVTIFVKTQVDCFEGQYTITPNGDQYNEYLNINCLQFFENELKIFNRWGQIVYTFKNYSNQWNGVTNEGKDLPDGTYYFIIELKSVTDKSILRGNVNIIR
jgi:gliding motility-associated-like protein